MSGGDELRCLKLSFVSRPLIEDLPLDEVQGPGDPLCLPPMEFAIRRKFTLLGVGLEVTGAFTVTLC